MEYYPLVSVIIPVYNCEKYIKECIESVINQTYKNMEIIVIDDGSTDNTSLIVKEFNDKINYVYQENKGASCARNKGIKLAKGDLFAFLDSDDVWVKNKLELQVEVFKEQKNVEIVLGYVLQFFSPDIDEEKIQNTKNFLGSMPGYVPDAMLINRKTFFKVGLFKEDKKLREGIDWFSRVIDMNLNIKMLSDVMVKRRVHNANKSRGCKKDILVIIKESLMRKRKNGQTIS